MAEDRLPLLGFDTPAVIERPKQTVRDMPRLSKPGAQRQGERLAPQFRSLVQAFDAERARLTDGTADETDPALVLVLDLAGSVSAFRNALNQIEGLEFLTELLGDPSAADDDFHLIGRTTGRTESTVPHSLYLVMSNARAVDELMRLFVLWQQDPSTKFEYGLGKFKQAFDQLRAIRRWGPEDRIRETGLLANWQETLAVVGQSPSTVLVEVELWHRGRAADRAAAESHVAQTVTESGGRVLDRSQIDAIAYHALLAELPIQRVQELLSSGAGAIQLLSLDDVMFVSPFTPMTIAPTTLDPTATVEVRQEGPSEQLPRIALLDGLPFQNHDALTGRLIIDDPDGLGESYAVSSRNHGTGMASLIIHGDLSAPGEPLDRPLYVRPIMRPHEFFADYEQVVPHRLFTDLLHRVVRRIVEGEGERPAAAPSIRLVNVSIGAKSRALVRRMSPIGRLLDWLANEYNLLFIVSAGNHSGPILIPAEAANDLTAARSAVIRAAYDSSLLRGVLPPGDALNVVAVGATHADGLGDLDVPDTVWDLIDPGAPALYSATGPGVGRSIKPDLHHNGGRELYIRPVPGGDGEVVELEPAQTALTGPGLQVAAPGRGGATDAAVFTTGTSNATALVTRGASQLFDILEGAAPEDGSPPLPDGQYHPLLVRALLTHASGWGDWSSRLSEALGLDRQNARRHLTALLGYGRLDLDRLGTASASRAVLIAGGAIAREQRHTYEVPLPPSLRARAEWHRFTITLAYAAPTTSELTRYRNSRVYFATPDMTLAAGNRIDAEHNSVRRGSLQHEIIDGERAMVFGENASLPIHVECMDDAQRLRAGQTVRYALVVSVETAVATSTTIHEEISARLRERTRERARASAAT